MTYERHDRVWPLSDAARTLRVPTKWLREEADAGRIPHLKAGDRLLFDLRTVERVLLQRARRGEGVSHAN